MDYKAVFNKVKDLNKARHILTEDIAIQAKNAIREKIMEDGFTDIDGTKVLGICVFNTAEIKAPDARRSSYAHELYINPDTNAISVVGSYEILLANEDTDCFIDELSVDEIVNILQSIID